MTNVPPKPQIEAPLVACYADMECPNCESEQTIPLAVLFGSMLPHSGPHPGECCNRPMKVMRIVIDLTPRTP